MKKNVTIGIILAILLVAVIAGYVIFFTSPGPYAVTPGYPIDSQVHTTLDRTVLPAPVPSTSPLIHPYHVANYSEYGYGAWQFSGVTSTSSMTALM